MPTLNISPDFTLEDIRKIRDYTYEIIKDMSDEERINYFNNSAQEMQEKIERIREKRATV